MTSPTRRNFGIVGSVEIKDPDTLFKSAELVRGAADDAANVLDTWNFDVFAALSQIPVIEGNRLRKAKRVSRHAKRCAEQILAARDSAKALEREFKKTYEAEIQAARKKTTFKLDGQQQRGA